MINKLIEFSQHFWSQAIKFFQWALTFILDNFGELIISTIETLLGFIITVINSIDFLEITTLNSLQTWTGLSDQSIWLLNYINFPICMAAILAAFGIRLLINLIPATFTRV